LSSRAAGKLELRVGIYVWHKSLLFLICGRAHVPAVIAIDGFEGLLPTEEIFERYFLLLLSAKSVFYVERFLVELKLGDFAIRNWCRPTGEVNTFVV
jgi:hypothetical protein